MESISGALSKAIPSLPPNESSLRECIMPPPKLQLIPDMDANTQNYFEKIKIELDDKVIRQYEDLGNDLDFSS